MPICSRHSTFAHLLGHNKQRAIAGAEKLTWRGPSRVRDQNVPICVLQLTSTELARPAPNGGAALLDGTDRSLRSVTFSADSGPEGSGSHER